MSARLTPRVLALAFAAASAVWLLAVVALALPVGSVSRITTTKLARAQDGVPYVPVATAPSDLVRHPTAAVQEIRLRDTSLARVDLQLFTFGQTLAGEVRLRVNDSSGRELRTATLDAATVIDGGLAPFVLDPAIAVENTQRLRLRIEFEPADAESTGELAVGGTQCDCLDGGDLTIGGKSTTIDDANLTLYRPALGFRETARTAFDNIGRFAPGWAGRWTLGFALLIGAAGGVALLYRLALVGLATVPTSRARLGMIIAVLLFEIVFIAWLAATRA